MKYIDKNDKELQKGDIIDIHQTVNGQNLFVVLRTDPLDIRYAHDLIYKYQYDKEEMLKPCKYSGAVDWEIMANIYSFISEIPHN